MTLQDALLPVRTRLSDAQSWLKYDQFDASFGPGAKHRIDLFRACELLVAPEACERVYERLSTLIRQTHGDRVSQPSHAAKYDYILDLIDFNNHRLTTHAEILTLLSQA